MAAAAVAAPRPRPPPRRPGPATPAPAPRARPPTAAPRRGSWDTPYAGRSVAIVNATRGGCVIVRRYPSGVNLLDQVILLPGWTYTVESNGGGTNSRVQLAFSNASTGEKAQIRVEAGKTIIS